MSDYDALPLDTPTKIRESAEVEIWATRTKNGGIVENRAKPGSAADLSSQADAQLRSAVANLRAYRDAASPTNAQTAAVVKLLCRVVLNLLRREFGDPHDPIE